MKSIFFTGILIFFTFFITWSQTIIDSLFLELKTCPTENVASIYNQIAKEYLNPSSLDSSLKYVEKALNIAKKNSQKEETAKSYKILGTISYYKQDFEKAAKIRDCEKEIHDAIEAKKINWKTNNNATKHCKQK